MARNISERRWTQQVRHNRRRPEPSTPALADMNVLSSSRPPLRQQRWAARQYKDFITMTQPDPIDTTLAELRQSFADISTMINIAIAFRRHSSHLLILLRSIMSDLCEQIDQALPILPAGEGESDV
jgi:hypothetical protein